MSYPMFLLLRRQIPSVSNHLHSNCRSLGAHPVLWTVDSSELNVPVHFNEAGNDVVLRAVSEHAIEYYRLKHLDQRQRQ